MDELKFIGRDQELRTSTLIWARPIRGESHVDFLGESEGSLPPHQDSLPDGGEAINDFWSMSGSFKNRHHVEPRVKLYRTRKESFPIPLKHIDVSRSTQTTLDVCKKAASTTVGTSMGQEICPTLGQVSLSLLYWMKNLPTEKCGREEINKKTVNIQAR